VIWFDRTTRSIVAGCKVCGPPTRHVFNDSAEADRWAADHLQRAHPAVDDDRITASAASRKRHQRAR